MTDHHTTRSVKGQILHMEKADPSYAISGKHNNKISIPRNNDNILTTHIFVSDMQSTKLFALPAHVSNPSKKLTQCVGHNPKYNIREYHNVQPLLLEIP